MSLEALKRNGHNLELGRFELAGEYGVPVLRPVSLPGRLEWIRFNHALREAHRDRYGVHFFIDDYLFQRAWHDPPRYALFLRQFPAVLTPDFSMFTDYPPAVQIYNHWRKHQLYLMTDAASVTHSGSSARLVYSGVNVHNTNVDITGVSSTYLPNIMREYGQLGSDYVLFFVADKT